MGLPSNDLTVRLLAFAGAAAAVIAASDIAPAGIRLPAAALAAGCSAVLGLMRSPGQLPPAPRPPILPPRREEGRG